MKLTLKKTIASILCISMIPSMMTGCKKESTSYSHTDFAMEMCIRDSYTVEEKAVLCITRSADINPDDEIYESTDDYRTHMKKVIKMRARLKPVRLEIEGNRHKEIKDVYKRQVRDLKITLSDTACIRKKDD